MKLHQAAVTHSNRFGERSSDPLLLTQHSWTDPRTAVRVEHNCRDVCFVDEDSERFNHAVDRALDFDSEWLRPASSYRYGDWIVGFTNGYYGRIL